MSGPPKKRAKQSKRKNHGKSAAAPSKRRKAKGASAKSSATQAPRKNSNRGRLAMLMSMPVDIFYEIARNLTPGDLLNIARSTHSWRTILMTRESKPIWHAARDNVDLPDCPADLSEPQYADLLYSRGCMVCFSKLAKGIYFAIRKRVCSNCYNENVIRVSKLLARDAPDLYARGDKTMYSLLPYYVKGLTTDTIIEIYLDDGYVDVWVDEFKDILKLYASLHGQERQNWVNKRVDYIKGVIEKHAKLIDLWMKGEQKKKADEKKAASKRRREAIFWELGELGYEDDDFVSIDEERWRKLVEEPKDLTDRIWKRIKPDIVDMVEDEKANRIEREEEEIEMEIEMNSWGQFDQEDFYDYDSDYFDDYYSCPNPIETDEESLTDLLPSFIFTC